MRKKIATEKLSNKKYVTKHDGTETVNLHLTELWNNAIKFEKKDEFRKLLKAFIKQIKHSSSELTDITRPESSKSIIFHKIKGSARQLGLRELGECAEFIEDRMINRMVIEPSHQSSYLVTCTTAVNELERWIQFLN